MTPAHLFTVPHEVNRLGCIVREGVVSLLLTLEGAYKVMPVAHNC